MFGPALPLVSKEPARQWLRCRLRPGRGFAHPAVLNHMHYWTMGSAKPPNINPSGHHRNYNMALTNSSMLVSEHWFILAVLILERLNFSSGKVLSLVWVVYLSGMYSLFWGDRCATHLIVGKWEEKAIKKAVADLRCT